MSDVAAAESAPLSSGEIASQVIESAEQDATSTDNGGESDTAIEAADSGDEPPARTDAPAKAVEAKTTEGKRAADFLRKLGHEMKRSDGRRAFMPAETVAKMLDQYLDESTAGWTTERTTLESRAKQADELQAHLEQFRQSVMGDPTAFLTELANNDPRYKRFLEAKAEAQAGAMIDAAFPDGDYPLPDGSRTFSLEGIKSTLVPWIVKQVEAGLLPKVDERLKPITEREKQAQAKADHDDAVREINTRTQTKMQEAQAWPMFGKLPDDGSLTDFQQEVLGELRKEREEAEAAGRRPTMSLRQAYLEVESRYKTTDYNTVRERVLKEVEKAPKSPALARGTVDAPRAAGPSSTADIVRKVIANAERGN